MNASGEIVGTVTDPVNDSRDTVVRLHNCLPWGEERFPLVAFGADRLVMLVANDVIRYKIKPTQSGVHTAASIATDMPYCDPYLTLIPDFAREDVTLQAFLQLHTGINGQQLGAMPLEQSLWTETQAIRDIYRRMNGG